MANYEFVLRSALLSRNYHLLFSSRKNAKPGPKGPADDLVRVIVELKQRNAHFGCPRIAQQINKAFGVNIDKDVYSPSTTAQRLIDGGPSWLTFLRHTRDSLSSIPLSWRKSILPKFHSILLAIGQHTRQIIGCGIATLIATPPENSSFDDSDFHISKDTPSTFGI